MQHGLAIFVKTHDVRISTHDGFEFVCYALFSDHKNDRIEIVRILR